jgi:hypothetical protein
MAGGAGHDLFLIQFFATEFTRFPPFMQHQDAVAHAEDFRQFGRDHDDRLARLGQCRHDLVHLGLGTDVDAACRLVENEDLRLAEQPFGEHHLLLIAAAQRIDVLVATRRLDAERRGSAASTARFLGA